jgi:hypothetical protein
MAHIYRDMAMFEPTMVSAPSRFWNAIFADFQERTKAARASAGSEEAARAAALEGLRYSLGRKAGHARERARARG